MHPGFDTLNNNNQPERDVALESSARDASILAVCRIPRKPQR